MTKYLYFGGLSLLLLCGITFAQQNVWKTYTNMNDIRDIAISGHAVWCATNGGIFKFDKTDGQFKQFSNVEGLSSIDVQCIEVDSDRDIWIGLFTGVINLFNPETNYFEPIYDYERHIINDLVVMGDSILVGFDNGVSLYVKTAREVKESYYSLGEFEDRINVNKLFLDGADIWAATNSGIAKSSLDKINLKDPKSWINYTTSDGLPSNTIRSFAKADDQIYAATDEGVARLDENLWQSVNNGLGSTDVYTLFENQDTLYAGTSHGVFKLISPSSWAMLGDQLMYVQTLSADAEGILWAGREGKVDRGLAFYEPDSIAWQTMLPPGPASNKFVDVAVDRDNVIWCACGIGGIQYFDGTTWASLQLKSEQIRTGFATVVVDNRNRKWFGSLGGGITMVDAENQVTTFTEPYLSNASPNYFIINDLDIDSQGNIWIVNRLASTKNPLVVVTPELEWQQFAQSSDGINSSATWVVEVDKNDRIWIGTDDKGVTVFDPGGTPLNTADDQIAGHLTVSDGLYSTKILSIVEDREGVMWIGTNKGLNRWYSIGGSSRVDSVYELISNEIQALEVDAQNNIWVGTPEGITMIPGNDRYARIEYSSDQTPLVNDFINSITFSGTTGDIFIGTGNGLSVFGTGYTPQELESYDSMQIYPNPFSVNLSNCLYIKNLALGTKSVQIMTTNGLLVRNIPTDNPSLGGFGGYVVWKGLNDRGEAAASGIYLIVAHTEDGRKNVSKVAVIRE